MIRVGLYPQEMRPCDSERPSFGPKDLAVLASAGAELDAADGRHYAHTFAAASALHKYVNDHYTLDLWSRAVARGQVGENERTAADLEALARRKLEQPATKSKGKSKIPRGQKTLA
jgi:hypothetical protein